MFALLINRCEPLHRARCNDIVQMLAAGDQLVSIGVFRVGTRETLSAVMPLAIPSALVAQGDWRAVVCGQPLLFSDLSTSNGFSVIGDQGRDLNTLLVQCSYDDVLSLLVSRHDRAEFWLGWYRTVDGLDLVVAHQSRDAIAAACEACGCLFDQYLQLWLIEQDTSALYVEGTRRVISCR